MILDIAVSLAKQSRCTRRKVGAVVVSPAGYVLGGGYNHLPKGFCDEGDCPRGKLSYEECPAYGSYSNCKAIHAEVAAINHARAQFSLLPDGCSLIVTADPCEDCAKVIRETKEITQVFVVASPQMKAEPRVTPVRLRSNQGGATMEKAIKKLQKQLKNKSEDDFPTGTVIRWKSGGVYTYGAIKAGNNRWYITGTARFYGSSDYTTEDFIKKVLMSGDVSDVDIATDWVALTKGENE